MANISALITFLVAMIPIFIVRPPFGDPKVSQSVVIYMLLATSVAFVVPYGAAPVFFLAAAIIASIATAGQSLAVYFAAFVYALPAGMDWRIPFPGINYLISISPMIVFSFMLLPTLFRERFSGKSGGTTLCVVLFVLATWMLDLRFYDQSATNALRGLINALMASIVPYLVLRKVLADKDRLKVAATAFSIVAFIITLMALWGVVRGWMFYTSIPLNSGGSYAGLFRDGALRFSAATNSVETPFIVTMGGMIALWLRKSWPKSIVTYGWLGVVPLGVLLSGSRGGLLAALLLVSGYVFFRYFPKGLRNFGYVSAAIIAFIGFPIALTMDFSVIDPYGTFEYRQRLLQTALTRFGQTLLIGDANYSIHPIFEPMRQGQGIIDFVNTYVQIGLGYGLLGLGLFIGILMMPLRLVLKTAYATEPDVFGEGVNAKLLGFGIAAAICAHAIMIMTVSEVSHIGSFKYLIAAFAVAYAEAVRKAQLPEST